MTATRFTINETAARALSASLLADETITEDWTPKERDLLGNVRDEDLDTIREVVSDIHHAGAVTGPKGMTITFDGDEDGYRWDISVRVDGPHPYGLHYTTDWRDTRTLGSVDMVGADAVHDLITEAVQSANATLDQIDTIRAAA